MIPSSAVHQNQNLTPLFVPNVPSLSTLFGDVLRKAKVDPRDVSLVEAHGTGTPVGDPAEYDSIRRTLGGAVTGRQKKLPIGSVKGHIGHTEGASGVLALIKVIMMMRGSFIPPQASYQKMNHHIDVRPDDMMEVVTKLKSWEEEHKIALLNNYGACGSNASLIVAQPPKPLTAVHARCAPNEENSAYPFWIPGFDARAISAYAAKVAEWCRTTPSANDSTTMANLSFAVNRQSNRGLAQGLVFSCRSPTELEAKLEQAASVVSTKDATALTKVGITPIRAERPVILCFGGQVSTFVGLDRKLYDRVAIIRHHLDACDAVVTGSCGLGSIYPDIFSQQPVQDTVKLQTMLFAMQYACAKAWMECGLEGKIAAVVGHSFGEITALCVAGVLSLQDAFKLVAARAKLVRDAWGADSGAMIAVEADEALVRDLLKEASHAADGTAGIACYNGPRTFTLAGSTAAVDAIQKTLSSSPKFSTAGIKSKRLNVTNAFHSTLVEKLVDDLGRVGKSLTFHKSTIPVERATEVANSDVPDWTFVPEHMRQPVFFHHAVQRLAKRYPRAVFLEAGSNSTITIMAAKALAQNNALEHHYQAISITNTSTGFNALTDATIALWKQGLRVAFWAHHQQQTLEYAPLLLPPYQFDKSPASRHWLPVPSPLEAVEEAAEALLRKQQSGDGLKHQAQQSKPLTLWDFLGYQDKKQKTARFRINTESEQYQSFFTGHLIAQTAPICPGTLECDISIEALFSLQPSWKERGMQPIMRDCK